MPSPNADEKLSKVDLSELPDVQLPGEVNLPETLPVDETTAQTMSTLDKLPEMPKLSEYVTGQLLPSYANPDINVREEAQLPGDPAELYWPSQEIAEPAGSSRTLMSTLDDAPSLDLSGLPPVQPDLPDRLPVPRAVKEADQTPGFSAVLSASHYGPTAASHTFTVPVPNFELPDRFGHSALTEHGDSDPSLPLLQEIRDGLKSLKPPANPLPSSSMPTGAIQLSTLYPRQFNR